MNLRLIRWQLPLSYAAIALLAILLLGVILSIILMQYYSGQEIKYLTDNAIGIELLVRKAQESELSQEMIQQLLDNFAMASNVQVRLLDKDGEILIDTGSPQTRMAVYLEATTGDEVPAADTNTTFTIYQTAPLVSGDNQVSPTTRFISEEDKFAIYYEIGPFGGLWMIMPGAGARLGTFPQVTGERSNQSIQQPYYSSNNELLGFIEMSNGPAYGREIVRRVAWGWAIAGSMAILIAAAVGWMISGRFSTPLNALADVTYQMSSGNLSARAEASTVDEFGILGRSFNEMADHIESLVSTLENFVADAAHELNTPLTALHTNLELVAESGPELSLEDLEQAREQVDRLILLVNNLLELSHIEASVKSEAMINIRDLVAEVGEIYASRAEQQEINFLLKFTGEEVLVAGDTSQLRRMLENLLSNALKFTNMGGSVELELSCDEKQALVCVKDSGIGIPLIDQEKVFQRFHRGRNAYAYPGSGLGLAIVKMIVTRHGGEILLESSPEGTCVMIRLPRLETTS
ncbi:MAG TPA: HAMP domain-containing sensor histidine kinase [Anaerolineales bacterium]|nr:HAMP domain-containing sensor histidine kinase [Anaerolineales bacterium]